MLSYWFKKGCRMSRSGQGHSPCPVVTERDSGTSRRGLARKKWYHPSYFCLLMGNREGGGDGWRREEVCRTFRT